MSRAGRLELRAGEAGAPGTLPLGASLCQVCLSQAQRRLALSPADATAWSPGTPTHPSLNDRGGLCFHVLEQDRAVVCAMSAAGVGQKATDNLHGIESSFAVSLSHKL